MRKLTTLNTASLRVTAPVEKEQTHQTHHLDQITMLNYVPRHVYTLGPKSLQNGTMSATSVYRVYPHSDLETKKPTNLEIKDVRVHGSASRAAVERELKRMIRREVRQCVRAVGVGQMNNTELNRCKRICWFVATVLCLVVSSYFVGNQVRDYLDRNTVLQSTLAQSAHIKVPAITLCPGAPALSNANTKKTLSEMCAAMKIDQENCANTSFERLNTNISDIWQVVELPLGSIHVSSQCPIDEVSAIASCIVPTESAPFDSFWGKCLIVSPVEKEHYYRGPHSYYNITIANENQYNQYDLINMYLHNAESTQHHLSYFKSNAMKKREYISISIQPKEYKMLSKDLKNCTDTPKDLNCVDKCLDEKLSEHVTCRLPFMQSNKLPFCDNYHAAMQALQETDNFYRTVTRLTCAKCGERCRRVAYLMGVNNVGPTDDNSTQLLFYYQDNNLETVTQTRDYPFSKVLSDIGGVLGFFLGFSVLGMLELIQQFVHLIDAKFCKKKC